MKRFLRLLAVAAALLLLCGCMSPIASDSPLFPTTTVERPAPEASQAEDITSLRVAYSEDDGLNPYEMRSEINQKLSPLLYDSLFKLDDSLSAIPCMAASYAMEENRCVVTLRGDIAFSDGSPLTAEDVAYSAGLARAEGSPWQQALAEVTEVTAAPGGQVIFALEQADAYFTALLTFPILKSGSAEAPVGSGRYFLQGEGTLALNENWFGGGIRRIKTIQLISQPDKETLIYSLKVGTIDYIYSDLSDETAANAGGSFQYVSLNNLVYLGMNRSGLLSQPAFRKMLEAALNRNAVVENSYFERAAVAAAPFPPQWPPLADLEYSRAIDQTAIAEYLEGLGFSARGEDGRLISSAGAIDLTLLVNEENSYRVAAAAQIQQQLKSAGIGVTVVQTDFATYQSRIASGDYDLFLGEVKLKANMDLSELLSPEGTLAFGGRDETLWAVYLEFRAGRAGLKDFLDAFYESVPFIPLACRRGAVSFTRAIYYGVEASEQDIFYNIQDW
ncbi:MAG: ABC transporter substrate-binding protein [Oscillospiraceae bacterium]|nr:ABC transporter substrate-binding protein [Oscillospiraceae bacterium]